MTSIPEILALQQFGIDLERGAEIPQPFMYTEHFTIFADLLGFQNAIGTADDGARLLSILSLLKNLSALQSDFCLTATPSPNNNGKQVLIKPAINTFSDHIVISYSLDHVYTEFGERGLQSSF